MNVGRKLMLIVIASVALVSVPSAGIIYYFAKQKILSSERTTLANETKTLGMLLTQNLLAAEPSLKTIARELKEALSEPPRAGEDAAFDLLIERDADKAWRSRRENFDGHKEAGIFLPPNAPLDVEQKRLHLRSKRVMDGNTALVHPPFSSLWFTTYDKAEFIYDHNAPDFALNTPADTDYTNTPWFTLGSPANNPERGIRWTPPLFDPSTQKWMVSAVFPVDVNGRWIGTIGHDIYLNSAFSTLFQQGQRYTHEQHFLLDAQSNYIQAGSWQKTLEAKPEGFKPDLRQEPDLTKLLTQTLSAKPQAFEQKIVMQNRDYLVVGMTIQPLGWRYFRLVPTDEILAPTRHLFYSLIGMVLAVGLLIGVLIEATTRRNIVARLQALANTVHCYGAGNLNVRAAPQGDDEIAKTARAFNLMADQLQATITKHEQAESLLRESDKRFYTAANAAPVMIWMTDTDRENFWFNQVWEDFTGQSHEHSWTEIHPDDLQNLQSVYYHHFEQRTPYSIEYRLERHDGEYRWLHEIAIPRFDIYGVFEGYIGSCIDFTDQIIAQNEIIRAKQAAEELARAKSEFLANMSHEIRTPMNGIIGLSKLALNQPMPDELRDYVLKIHSSSEHLLGILNNILDFSKMEANKISLEHAYFNLATMFNTLNSMFSTTATEKGIALNFEIAAKTPVDLMGDALRLQQILSNLLGNALKFTEHGKVSVQVKQLNSEGAKTRLHFCVSDTGIGMSEQDQSKLFQPFSQADSSTTRRFGGTGLGLNISQQLLKLMGSDFHVESHPNQGASFSFELLLDIASPVQAHSTAPLDERKAGGLTATIGKQGASLNGIHLMVAEDNIVNQVVVKKLLLLSGITSDIANNGMEALEMLEKNTYAAVLMDVHMPEMGGIEATEAIRQQARFDSLPIIALTADVTQEDRDHCMASGMNDFLPKPINPEQLISTLLRWVKPSEPPTPA